MQDRKTSRRRHRSAKEIPIPKTPDQQICLIRKLTREIKLIARHLTGDPANSRDRRSRMSLEAKINSRAALIDQLAESNPTKCRALLTELGLLLPKEVI